MAELFAAPIVTNRGLDALGLDQFQSSPGEVLGATWDETLASNPTPLVSRAIERGLTNQSETAVTTYDEFRVVNPEPTEMRPNPYFVESPLLTPEEANKKYGITSNGKRVLGWDSPVREREADELNTLKRNELLRQDIIRRGGDGFFLGAAKLGVGLAGSVIDPTNILAAFIPVVGEANFARLLATTGSRTAARAITGVIEGGVGAAMLEPMIYGLSRAEQRDYTMSDSLMNIAFGSLLGGGLHVAGGFAKDRLFGLPKVIDDTPLETKRAMLGESLMGVIEDRPIRADLALREELLGGSSNLTPLQMARRQFETAMGPFQPDPNIRVDMGGVRFDPPHPAPDRTGTALPLLTNKDTALTFTTERRAQNAVDRIERQEGYRPDVIRVGDSFVLRRETPIEPIYKADGTVQTFRNERQALKFRDEIMRDPNLDIMPVSDGGPVRYAVVAGATAADLKAARANPEHVGFRPSRDVESKIQEQAGLIQLERERLINDVKAELEGRARGEVQLGQADFKLHAENEARIAQSQHRAMIMDRPGGQTERALIEREIADFESQLKAVDEVGELPPEAKAIMKEADDLIAQAEARGSLYDRIAACIRGTV